MDDGFSSTAGIKRIVVRPIGTILAELRCGDDIGSNKAAHVAVRGLDVN
jgi:hypothetical protein